MFKLVIEDDEGNKTVVPIIRDEITIGRKDGNTIRLTERNVSRDHARLVREDGDVFYEDVSARYGTKKNGDKISGRTDFSVGDVFSIGDYRLTLQSDVVAEPKPPKLPNGAATPSKASDGDETKVRPDPPRKKEGTEIIAADPAKLVIVSSNFAGQEFPLARKEMVIGRGEECDIIIDHRSVSQKHAKIVREQNGEYKIVDLKSKNGVKVGGEEYRAVHLKRGDIVELGHVKFRFVEPGENYIFTPQTDDEGTNGGESKRGMMVGGAVVFVVVALVAAFMFVNGRETPEPVAVAATTSSTTGTEEPLVATDTTAANPLDAKIDRAEQDYIGGKVQKAAGALELLREESSINPDQVARIDDLLSKAKREKGFVRYFENGRDHFEAGQWLEALGEFRQIPDDNELNIYRLVKEAQYIDKSVANATEEQLELAKNAADASDRDDARDKLSELQAMFPSHVAPPEALAELAALSKPASKPKPPKDPRKPDKVDSGEVVVNATTSTDSAELADNLYSAAMKEMLAGNYKGAISKARGAIDNGCTGKCYRVVGMAHHKLGQPKKACTWLAKADSELPSDLDCP